MKHLGSKQKGGQYEDCDYKLMHTLSGHSNYVTAVAVSADGQRVVSGSSDRMVKIWDAESGQERFTLSGHTGSVSEVAVFPDGEKIVAGIGKEVKVWKQNKMVLTRKANDVVDKIGLNDDILRMIKDKLPTCRKELNRLQK